MNYDKSHLMSQMVHEHRKCGPSKGSVNEALRFWPSKAFHLIIEPAKSPLYLTELSKKPSMLFTCKYTLDLAKENTQQILANTRKS